MRKERTRTLILSIMLLLIGEVCMAQNVGKNITMSCKDMALPKALSEVEQKSGYYKINYNYDELKDFKVTADIKNKKADDAVKQLLSGLPYAVSVKGNFINVNKTNKGKSKKIVAGDTKQEDRVAKGRIIDSNGEPLMGVSIRLAGTDRGAHTDADGNYRMENVDEGSVLEFSYLGMRSLSRKVTSRPLVIVMESDDNLIDDVVVNGYYSQAKNSFTGAAKTFSQEQILAGSNQNILTALQNVDPSFVLVENNAMGSNPNALPEFTIRGSGSLTGMSDTYQGNPNMPVFIVDGFETTAEKVFDMDPYRIQSVTLLKDAAATAIYGSRASNGVVVITTSTPKFGKLAVSYNADATFYMPDLSAYNLCSPEQKLQLEKLSGLYDASKKQHIDVDFVTDQIAMNQSYDRRLQAVLQGVNTDWMAQPLNQLTVGHKHSIRIDGGSENFRYAMNLNYNNTPGVMKQSGRERMAIGTELQYIYKNITFRDQLTFSNINAKNSPYGSFSTYTTLNPYCRMTNADGSYIYQVDMDDRRPDQGYFYDRMYNPLFNSTLNYKDQSNYRDLTNLFGVDWQILDGLRLKGSFALTVQNNSIDVFKSGKHTDFANLTGDDFDRRGSYTASRGDVFNYDGNLVLSYFKQLDNHVINVNAGWNIQQEQEKEFTVKAEGFPNDNLDYISFGTQYEKNGSPMGDEYTSRLMGFLGNINYSYMERYLLDLSFREDASSRFGADKRWAPFWSAGIGWNLHNESFMKSLGFVNRLKPRATYGLTGSQNFDPYQAMTTYRYMTGHRYHYGVGSTLLALGNDDLAWQRTHEFNVGADLGLFKDRFQLTFDYYVKNTKDLLTAVTLPPSLGFTTYMANLGEVQNKGWELSLRANIIQNNRSKIYWSLFGSMIHNTNKLLKISESLKAYNKSQDDSMIANSSAATAPRVRYVEGESINSIWVNQSLGIDPLTGREMFLDKDGNKVSQWSADNYVIGGCLDPKVEGTFGTLFSYKGFQLNATFRYRMGGQMYNQTLVDKVQDVDPRYNCDARALTDRWQKPGDIARYAGFTYDIYGVNVTQATRPTSRFVQNYNYLTLSTLNLSYEFANKNLINCGIQRLKLLFYMNDVFYTSTVKMERGTDYPYARNFSVGVNATF